ncbi:MBL fold metallo-hydrolase [Candidatus Paracaedibacter symbiosus]|uniref:MBL fold metallo-hydrolase n=1 Tax=Candidatus Paracaedibacter symbiosus TaxID=244582 RepID=UPI00068B4D6C|nr:MBL fold metallo-hydrolase [Candidatus Paracaedibacter symbiosus]
MKVTFWGTRGSYPIASPQTIKVGGRTSCVSVEFDQQLIIFDAGTGLISLGEDSRLQYYTQATILLSHLHHDHIMGIPFFKPIFLKEWTLNFYSGHAAPFGGLEKALQTCFSPPYFPVPWEDFPATRHYHEFEPGRPLSIGSTDVMLETMALDHPGGACGYRLSQQGHTIVYLTDTKHSNLLRPEFIRFSQGADMLIYDSTFTDTEFDQHPDWGHSTWKEATAVAKAAKVKSLALFHHNPDHSDEEMQDILTQAQAEFAGTILGTDGLGINL